MTGWRPWALLGMVLLIATVVVLALINERTQRRRRAALDEVRSQTSQPRQSRPAAPAAEHDRTGVEPGPAVELFPGVPDTHMLTECPMVDAPGGAMALREWLKHFAGVNIWPTVVARFYTAAAADPEIADFFRGVDMEKLQRHFLAALMIVTGQGVTVGVIRGMQAAHAQVRNAKGQPITADTWDTVIGVLADVLASVGTPGSALTALVATIAPIRAVIVVEPGSPVR